MGHGRWPDQLWTEPRGYLSPGRHLRGTDPHRREASRSAGAAADDIRASRQSQDRQGARPDGAAVDPRPRRRGYRMRQLWLLLLALAYPLGASTAGERIYRLGELAPSAASLEITR